MERTLRQGATALNVIHHGDHHARHDKNLHPLNYLKYDNAIYDPFQRKKLNFQNRLRHEEFIDLLNAHGLEVVNQLVTGECIEEFQKLDLKVAQRFRNIPVEDLVVTRTQALSRKQ